MKGLRMRWRARLAKIAIGLGVAGLVLGFFGGIGVLAYFRESFPDWTGFARVPEYDAQGDVARYAPAKTLWDWLNLLLVPLVLTGGGIWFTRSENRQAREIEQSRLVENRKIEEERLKEARELEAQRIEEARELERERAQDSIVKDYLDQMTELLLTRGLRTSLVGDEVRSVASARTLTALRGIDGMRKGTIMQFLYEAGLIGYMRGEELVDAVMQIDGLDLSGVGLAGGKLMGADLSGSKLVGAKLAWADLLGADLSGADLSGADLTGACLFEAKVYWASLEMASLEMASLEMASLGMSNLRGVNLSGSDLIGTRLSDADLSGANLSGANLTGADLLGSNLDGAEFGGAILTDCQDLTLGRLREAKSLHGTTLPDHINPADLGDKWSPPKPENTPEPQP